MNTLRTSERKLTLLALKPPSGIKSQRAIQIRTFDSLLGNEKSYRRSFYGSKYGFGRFPRIKLQTASASVKQIDSRSLSTTPTTAKVVPLLNPNKPSPDEAKELVMEPIVPLTLPRFSRTNSDIPSVTKILQATMPASSQFILDRWRESMIKKLGVAGFNKYQRDTFARGQALHTLLAHYLLGHGEPTIGGVELSQEVVSNLWKSIQNVVRDKITNVRLVEHIVTHSDMNYRGIVDCVAFFEEELVVIDFKTAEKPKKNVESLYDNPLQVTAYCGAINNDTSIPKHVVDRNITSGVVIVAYIDGSEASTYVLKSEKVVDSYWKQWTTRLDQFSRLEEMKMSDKRKALNPKQP